MPINGLVTEAGIKEGIKAGIKAGAGTGGVALLFTGLENPKTAFVFIEFVLFPFVTILFGLVIPPPLETRSP
jgi:hypothetical protein